MDGHPSAIRFTYSVRIDGGEWQDMEYEARIVSTACHFGGRRYWFICPVCVDGRRCGRRCRCLYLAGMSEYFGCRECHALTYESRQKHRDLFWEVLGKRWALSEKMKKFRPPRGRKAVARRWLRMEASTDASAIAAAGFRAMLAK